MNISVETMLNPNSCKNFEYMKTVNQTDFMKFWMNLLLCWFFVRMLIKHFLIFSKKKNFVMFLKFCDFCHCCSNATLIVLY